MKIKNVIWTLLLTAACAWASVAISMKAAVTALQGNIMPQMISVPIPLAEQPNFKDGTNYYSTLSDNFFTPNEFPPCGVNLTSTEIMGKSEANQ